MNDHPLPNDLGALILIGAITIALAVVLPTTHTGALAIAGLALIHVALAAWTVRTLDRMDAGQQARTTQAGRNLADAIHQSRQL